MTKDSIVTVASIDDLNNLDLTTLDTQATIEVGYSGVFTRSDHARCVLEKTFQCKLRNVFVNLESTTINDNDIHDSLGSSLFFQNSKGVWSELWFSEWGGIKHGTKDI